MLSSQGYSRSFGPDTVLPYLAHTLRKQGELFPYYYGVAQSQLANGVALLSGQGPTVQTELNCPQFSDITPAKSAAEGQVLGDGCVYPASTQTLPGQLVSAGDTWKAYVEGMNDGAAGTAQTCRKPTLNAADPDQAPQAGDPYVTWRNPLVYFQSLDTACAKQDAGLQQLSADLQVRKKTPTLSYIVPSACDDGSETVCPGPVAPIGVTAADTTATTSTTTTTTTTTTPTTTTTSTPTTTSPTTSTPITTTGTVTAPATATAPTTAQTQASDQATEDFLRSVIPKIEASRAYKKNGLIAITFDEAPQTGPYADQTACCANPTYPEPAGDDRIVQRQHDLVQHDNTERHLLADHVHRHHDHDHQPVGHDDIDQLNDHHPGGVQRQHDPDRRRWAGRSAADLALHQAQHDRHHRLLQPLLAAGQHRAAAVAQANRLCVARPAADPPAGRLQRLQGFELVAFPAAVEQLEEAPQQHRLARRCRGT